MSTALLIYRFFISFLNACGMISLLQLHSLIPFLFFTSLHFTSSAFREPFILLPTPINNSTRYSNSNGNLSIQINNFYAFFFYSINNFILFPSLNFFLCKSPSLIYLPYKVTSTIKTVSSTLPMSIALRPTST